MDAKQGDWVRVHSIVLKSHERTANIPDDTKSTDLQMWIKGYLAKDANKGELVQITTSTGRVVEGVLVELAPSYGHSFGAHVPELLKIGQDVRKIISEGRHG